MGSDQELIITQQQVIYYRAEVAKYKNQIAELERQFEKELVRNKYLQSKIRELNSGKINGYIKEVEKLQKKILLLEVKLEEDKIMSVDNKDLAIQHAPPNNKITDQLTDLYSYFNYSILLPSEGETTISIYGTFTVVNIGEKELEDVVICLKVEPVGKVTLSGKISNPKKIINEDENRQDVDWVYAVDNWKEKIKNDGEYWIRSVLKPNVTSKDSLSFMGFELLLDNSEHVDTFKLEGYVYCSEKSERVLARNKLIINY